MKFNWGTGIFIFYSIFACSLIFIVYKSTRYDHSLVVEDYYAKDLAYQGRYDKMQNSRHLSEKLHVSYIAQSNQVRLHFPDSLADNFKGKLLFYRADNKKEDWLIPISTDADNDMIIDVSKLTRGRWKVQVDWKANDKEFYDEAVVYLQTP